MNGEVPAKANVPAGGGALLEVEVGLIDLDLGGSPREDSGVAECAGDSCC